MRQRETEGDIKVALETRKGQRGLLGALTLIRTVVMDCMHAVKLGLN